jgi:hypothetical protein
MIHPLFEKLVIFAGGLLVLAGLAYLYSHFPTQAVIFVVAAIAGTAGIWALIYYFTRSPA